MVPRSERAAHLLVRELPSRSALTLHPRHLPALSAFSPALPPVSCSALPATASASSGEQLISSFGEALSATLSASSDEQLISSVGEAVADPMHATCRCPRTRDHLSNARPSLASLSAHPCEHGPRWIARCGVHNELCGLALLLMLCLTVACRCEGPAIRSLRPKAWPAWCAHMLPLLPPRWVSPLSHFFTPELRGENTRNTLTQ